MPTTMRGLLGFVVTAILTVIVGLWIINRVSFLNTIVYGKKAA
jgi:hypothetical protein